MDVEKLSTEGIIFKGAKNPSNPKDAQRVKTKAKKSSYAKGTHGSASAKMKSEIKKRVQARNKKKRMSF